MKHALAFLLLALSIRAAEPAKIAPATEPDARLHADGQGWKLDKAKISDPKLPRVLLIGDSIVGGASATLDLKAGVKAQGALLDCFGIVSGGTGGGEVKFSLDDLKYSAGKP